MSDLEQNLAHHARAVCRVNNLTEQIRAGLAPADAESELEMWRAEERRERAALGARAPKMERRS